MNIAGATVVAKQKNRYWSEAQLIDAILNAEGRGLDSFWWREEQDGPFCVAVLGPDDKPLGKRWSVEVVAPTYTALRGSLRQLGLGPVMRKKDIKRLYELS
jgi:hypothetical protein